MNAETEDADIPGELKFNTLVELGENLINAILGRGTSEEIQALIDIGAPLWYQSEDEGLSPLHAAAYTERVDVVKLLIDAGALWNAVDNLQSTAADVALSLNNSVIYTMIRDAGIRTELLLTLLSSSHSLPEPASALVLKGTDSTAAGSTDVFLSSCLRFTKDAHGQEVCLVDVGAQEIGVMMGWEAPIMQETVHKLCHDHEHFTRGLRVLNIGFGLGIIDNLFQSLSTSPSQHVIIEPHCDVLQHIKELGWYNKKGVKIFEGKWQDFVDCADLPSWGRFDIIFTDTFAENYQELHHFFQHIPNLLADRLSRFSFFNGLGATNALFYDVFSHLSELHLGQVGMKVEWSDVNVMEADADCRWGQTRKYFTLPNYRLPLAVMSM